MQYSVLVLTILLALALIGCGSAADQTTNNPKSSQPLNLSGNWSASLTNTATQQQSSINFTLAQGGSDLAGSAIVFSVPTQCFGATTSMVGLITGPSGATGTGFKLDVWSQSDHTGNHLAMAMTPSSDRTAAGTFSLTPFAQDCTSQSGTVSMNKQ